MRLLFFVLLELGLAPLQAAALLAYSYKLFRHNRPAGISGTAYEPLFTRLLMHEAGTRPDDAAARLAPELPALSPMIATLLGSVGSASRWSGYRGSFVEFPPPRPSTFSSMVAHRTDFFDRLIDEAIDSAHENTVKQIVILGAGWDTRAYGPLASTDIAWFEVDRPPTQRAKRAALDRAGLSSSHVRFVETDFNQRSWFQALTEQGFDDSLPTFILWEGVTMYLDDESVDATLRRVSQMASGSRIAFDFFSRELVNAEPPFHKLGKQLKTGATFYGEPFRFGISTKSPATEQVSHLVSPLGLELVDHESFGTERPPKIAPIGGLALAMVPGRGRTPGSKDS